MVIQDILLFTRYANVAGLQPNCKFERGTLKRTVWREFYFKTPVKICRKSKSKRTWI